MSPVVPSMVISSPSLTVRPSTDSDRLASSTDTLLAPTMHGRPMPRATRAAWLAVPPVWVSMPFAWTMPCTSLGLLSIRTRITDLPCLPHSSAVSASNTAAPLAAPGEAGTPRAMGSALAAGEIRGNRSCSSWRGSTRATASWRLIRRSATMSTAMFTAASPVRFAARVWSM